MGYLASPQNWRERWCRGFWRKDPKCRCNYFEKSFSTLNCNHLIHPICVHREFFQNQSVKIEQKATRIILNLPKFCSKRSFVYNFKIQCFFNSVSLYHRVVFLLKLARILNSSFSFEFSYFQHQGRPKTQESRPRV